MFNLFGLQRSSEDYISHRVLREAQQSSHNAHLRIDAMQRNTAYEINELRREIDWLKDQVKELQPK